MRHQTNARPERTDARTPNPEPASAATVAVMAAVTVTAVVAAAVPAVAVAVVSAAVGAAAHRAVAGTRVERSAAPAADVDAA